MESTPSKPGLPCFPPAKLPTARLAAVELTPSPPSALPPVHSDFAHNLLACLDIGMVAVFAADMLVQSRVARFDASGAFMDDAATVQQQYLGSTSFAADLLGCIPLDYIALGALGGIGHIDAATLAMLPVLKLVHLVRLYRVRNLITYLLFNLNVPLLWVTVIRNLMVGGF